MNDSQFAPVPSQVQVAAPEAIVIGASAGAVEALLTLLPNLPRDYPLPVFIVVHIPANTISSLSECFADRCEMTICEAEDKERIQPGNVYFAPPDYHLLIETNQRLALSSEEPWMFSRPSIDVLFESAADVYGPGLIGVILTGSNQDGSQGLRAVVQAGGTAVVQDPQSAAARAMPLAALEACPNALALNIPMIAAFLIKAVAPK